ncbi:nucleotidyltransferase domain-containing protein [Candidatus Micrarchaeota archaeon]|nr:nucleotidyltransferase domain-containing protein [Candidatus Micrarchaeota archaeon]
MKKTFGLKDIPRVVSEIKKALRGKVKRAYFFGSIVNNSAVPFESDVDLLIIPKTRLSSKQAYEILEPQLFALLDKGLVLHALVVNPKDKPAVLKEAKAKGVAIL